MMFWTAGDIAKQKSMNKNIKNTGLSTFNSKIRFTKSVMETTFKSNTSIQYTLGRHIFLIHDDKI